MRKIYGVIIAVLYLLLLLSAFSFFGYNLLFKNIFSCEDYNLLFECITIAGFGGVLYCLRGIYLNYCVNNSWDNKWLVWYFIRPIVSLLCGGVSYLFLKAGLLVLEAEKETNASNLGFYAFAFIAGLNVDKFIMKIEELAKATWGIEKSRTSSNENNGN